MSDTSHPPTPDTHAAGSSPINRDEYAKGLVKRLIETMKTLSALYESETTALETYKTKEFSKMQDEKLRHIRAYENMISEMSYFSKEIKAMPDSVKNDIRQSQAGFASIIMSNSAILQTTQSAMSRVGHTIGKAMRRAAHQSNAVNYDAGGALSSTNRKTISSGRISASA
jgi:hypothetical protein